MSTTIVRVRIEGRVQGVWFRGWTVETARRLGLEGWVRNRADGSVEAVFAGGDAAVEEMIGLCRRGPTAARVRSVQRFAATAEALRGRDFLPLPTV